MFRQTALTRRLSVLAAACVLLFLLTKLYDTLTRDDFKDFIARDSADVNLAEGAEGCPVCKSGVPCEYPDQVDFRVIVLGYNRDASLRKCLDNLASSVIDEGRSVAVEVWIDISADGRFHLPTYLAARNIASSWKLGRMCVHVQTEHSHVAGQWLFSWRPREHSHEVALIIEDDIDVSPYALRWLQEANRTFHDDASVYSYSLQMENVCAQHSFYPCIPIAAPPDQLMLKFPVLGTWGFSPKADFWRRFQDWYIETQQKDPGYKPYVEALRSNKWYHNAEKRGTEQTMAHEMWVLHYVYGHRDKLYCVYSNLLQYTGQDNVLLSSHRQENGLHYQNARKEESESKLLTVWKADYTNRATDCPAYDAFGNLVHNW